MGDVFEQYNVAQWRATSAAATYAFPVTRITEDGGNRIIERERAYRRGCKLDDTGSKATRWTLEAIFENSIQEPGAQAVNGALVLYPDVLNELIESFDLYHSEAGDLYVPTRGWIRARCLDYSRKEEPEEQDCARLTMVFVADNEDSIDAAAFTAPSVSANAIRLSNTTTFSSQSEGIWGDDSQSLEEFSAGLEEWANAPEDTSNEMETRVKSTQGSARRVEKAFSKPVKKVVVSDTESGTGAKSGAARTKSRSGRDVMRDPEAAEVIVKLHMMREMAAQSMREAGKGRPLLVTVVFERAQSLITIAAVFGQAIESLIAANPQLDDPLYIPAKTPVRVYDSFVV